MSTIYYAMKEDSEPLGEIKRLDDVEIQTTDPPELPTISMTDGISGEFEIELRRKDKKAWGEILQMPKYKVTEWMFPKKKPRGTMKRERRRRKRSAKTAVRNLARMIREVGVTAEQASEAMQKFAKKLQEMKEGGA